MTVGCSNNAKHKLGICAERICPCEALSVSRIFTEMKKGRSFKDGIDDPKKDYSAVDCHYGI